MSLLSILLLAMALAMDSFTVSVCAGMQMERVKLHYAARIALLFGLFQAVMPSLGWLGGTELQAIIRDFDHWLAFGLLAFIGGRMIFDALHSGRESIIIDPANWGLLLGLSLATSIDALAVGLTFAFLDVAITGPVIIIGLVTLGLSLAGVYAGHRSGALLQNKAQLVGGGILVFIGARILIDHLGLLSGALV